jgi:tRNA (guanosine-2'-O-)-methyltransferase
VDVQAHESLRQACSHLKGAGFALIAANLSDRARDYRDIDYTRPTALIVGTELFGCSEEAISLADDEVMIPMMGMTQSLNVSVACAIVLYEAMRQRQSAGLYDRPGLEPGHARRKRFRWIHPKTARWCDEHGVEYPDLDEAGDIVGKLGSSSPK